MNNLCFMSGLTSSDWAAWVQAIALISASIIAILSICIDRKNKKDDYDEHINNFIEICQECKTAASFCICFFSDWNNIYANPNDLDKQLDTLKLMIEKSERVPLNEVRSELVRLWIKLQYFMQTIYDESNLNRKNSRQMSTSDKEQWNKRSTELLTMFDEISKNATDIKKHYISFKMFSSFRIILELRR
jgi:hypothetical protein